MESANKNNIINSFNKLLKGTLNNKEKESLRAYIKSSYKDGQLDKLMRKHWESLDISNYMEETSLDHVKMKLWTLLHEKQTKQLQPKPKYTLNWSTYLSRIAAILFIPLVVYTGFLISHVNNQFEKSGSIIQQVYANPGSRLHFTLPDQTQVWLNSESSLEYPSNINDQKQRTVKLTGQGYFIVAHNPKQPFFVETNDLKVKVLGTSFDVYNYPGDQKFISTLEKGEIALLDKHGREVEQLTPGQQAIFDKSSRKLSIKNVETKQTTSWKDGYLIFRDSPLQEVIRVMERWFNCVIEVDPSLLNSDIKYSAIIQDETLGEVLQMIEISTNVKTTINKREVHIWAK